MKFITEEDLRDLYRKQPFMNYELRDGERLTPGARQFLVDRGIDMYDIGAPKAAAKAVTSGAAAGPDEGVLKKLRGRKKALRMLFLLTAEELLKTDVCVSRDLTDLCRYFTEQVSESGNGAGAPECTACSGMNAENFAKDIGDCFEITEFHMQMENGREMLLIARLRSELEVFAEEAGELLGDAPVRGAFDEKMNRIINTLSQMICKAMGGKECQRRG